MISRFEYAVAIMLFCCAVAIAKDIAHDKSRSDVGPFILVASLPKRTFEPGESIRLVCKFRNRSGTDFTIDERGFYRNHYLRVCDANGREARMTKLGRECRQLFAPLGGPSKTIPVRVRNQQTYRTLDDDNINDLTRLYDLAPGRYSVHVTLHHRGLPHGRVDAMPIDFVVKAPSGAPKS